MSMLLVLSLSWAAPVFVLTRDDGSLYFLFCGLLLRVQICDIRSNIDTSIREVCLSWAAPAFVLTSDDDIWYFLFCGSLLRVQICDSRSNNDTSIRKALLGSADVSF